jgi:glutamate synthase (ferredoxin)
MLVSDQVEGYFPDLSDPDMESAIAMVHSRFSTNTFPSWERAHPYRYVIHNGEINTLRGNINWFRAQEDMFESDLFGSDIKKLLPIIKSDGSDTAMFDNVLEFLVMTGRSLPHVMMMMIPRTLVAPRNHARRKTGLLRIPCQLAGTLGWPGGNGLLRWLYGRRCA